MVEFIVTRRMSYDYRALNPELSPESEREAIEALCEGFVRCNQVQIRSNPAAYPCCLSCGMFSYVPPQNCRVRNVRGESVDPDCQHVRGAATMLVVKTGTCIDLACLLAALYREKDGDPAVVVIQPQLINGVADPGMYHAVVRKGNGEVVDPQQIVIAAQMNAAAPACDC